MPMRASDRAGSSRAMKIVSDKKAVLTAQAGNQQAAHTTPRDPQQASFLSLLHFTHSSTGPGSGWKEGWGIYTEALPLWGFWGAGKTMRQDSRVQNLEHKGSQSRNREVSG